MYNPDETCIIGEQVMRTNVVLDDHLVKTALKLSGYKTKKEALEEGLKPSQSSEGNQGFSGQAPLDG